MPEMMAVDDSPRPVGTSIDALRETESALGLTSLQMLYMTSNVVSLERKDANEYFACRVVI